MSLYHSDYIKKTAIVKNINRAIAAGTVATPESLADGEVVVTDLSGNVLDTTTVLTQNKIRIVQGRGADKETVAIELGAKEITSYKGGAYEASVEEVAYFGFNGTSGSLTATNNYPYVPFVRLTSNTFFFGKQNHLYWYGPYTSPATGTTQAVVAKGIAKSFLANFKAQYEVDKFIRVERVADGTRTAPGSAGTLTFTKGSSTVIASAATAIDTPLAVGNLLSTGSGLDQGVYVVTGISGTTITLDIPFQGENAVVTATDTVVVATPVNWGVKLTGQVERFNIASFRNYDKLTFTVGESNGALTSEVAVEPKLGSGNPPQVQIDENASWGFEGSYYLLGIPPFQRPTDVSSTGKYASLAIAFKKSTNHMNGIGSVKGTILVYADGDGASPNVTGTNATGAATSVVDVLDAWVVAKTDFSAQAGSGGMDLA